MNNISLDILCHVIFHYLAPLDQRTIRLTCKELSILKYTSISKLMIRYIDEYVGYPVGQKLINVMRKYPDLVQLHGSIVNKCIHMDNNIQIGDLDIAVKIDNFEDSDHFPHKRYCLGKIDRNELNKELDIVRTSRKNREFIVKNEIRKQEHCKEVYHLFKSISTLQQDYGISPSYGIHDSYFTHFKGGSKREINTYVNIGETNVATNVLYSINISIQYLPESMSSIKEYEEIVTYNSNTYNGKEISMKNPKDVISKVGFARPTKYIRDTWFDDHFSDLQRLIQRSFKYNERGYLTYIHRDYLDRANIHYYENNLYDMNWVDSRRLEYLTDVQHERSNPEQIDLDIDEYDEVNDIDMADYISYDQWRDTWI